jgi:hypothetical protein
MSRAWVGVVLGGGGPRGPFIVDLLPRRTAGRPAGLKVHRAVFWTVPCSRRRAGVGSPCTSSASAYPLTWLSTSLRPGPPRTGRSRANVSSRRTKSRPKLVRLTAARIAVSAAMIRRSDPTAAPTVGFMWPVPETRLPRRTFRPAARDLRRTGQRPSGCRGD